MPRKSRPEPPEIDKKAVVAAIVAQISRDLTGLIKSAKASHEEATHEQNKAENKYDTRALEASYLAHGQSRQINELEVARQEFEALPVGDFAPGEPVDLGALVSLEEPAGGETFYFLGPKVGGTEIEVGGKSITVITPQSPLGRLVVGRKAGETIMLHERKQRLATVR